MKLVQRVVLEVVASRIVVSDTVGVVTMSFKSHLTKATRFWFYDATSIALFCPSTTRSLEDKT